MKFKAKRQAPYVQPPSPPLPTRRGWLADLPWGGVFVALLLSGMGGIYIYSASRYAERQAEALRTPPLHGMALVEQKAMCTLSLRELSLTFSLQNHYIRLTTRDDFRWQMTVPGDTVPVIYHVSKDGEYFIESWEPPIHPQKFSLHP